ASGMTLWADKIDVQSEDLFAVEDGISESLVRRLASDIPASAAANGNGRTASREAYEAYLRGRFEWNKRTADTFRRCSTLLHKAIHSDPRYAAAYAALADCRNLLGDALSGKRAALKPLELDPALAEAHSALGNALLFHDYDRPKAE